MSAHDPHAGPEFEPDPNEHTFPNRRSSFSADGKEPKALAPIEDDIANTKTNAWEQPEPEVNAATFTLNPEQAESVKAELAPPQDMPGYELLDELGRGGMGVVYRARQTRLNRQVALKMILAGEYASVDSRLRFLAEAEVVAKLQHPNIVQLYEFNVYNGVPYFSLEYVDGGALDRKLARQPLPVDQAAALIETLARAMHFAHEQGVIHRDLKPGNILLQKRPAGSNHSVPPSVSGSSSSKRGAHSDTTFGSFSCQIHDSWFLPKITDFGLAKSVTSHPALTQSGAVMGTPSYMAPEQAAGKTHEIHEAADTYALGAILYECLTGRPPFKSTNPVDTMIQVVQEEPVPPRRLEPHIPRDLETICLKCLHKDPAKRYTDTRALADDLTRFLAGDPIQARPVSGFERTARWARRYPSTAALLAVSTLLVIGIASLGWVTSAMLGRALSETEKQRELAVQSQADAMVQREAALASATEAEKQRALAETNLSEAQKQREAATANFTRRLDVIDDILFNMDARLENYSGMNSIRTEFLDEIRKFSDQLLQESPGEPSVLRQGARVYRSIGQLARSERDYRASDAAFLKAIAYSDALVKSYPEQGEYRFELARNLGLRAVMLWYARRLPDSLESWTQAIAHFDYCEKHFQNRDAATRAARSLYYRGNVLEDLKRKNEALHDYRMAMTRQEHMARDNPNDFDIQEDLGYTMLSLALIQEKDQPDEAVTLLQQALKIHQGVARRAPYWPRARSNITDAYDDLYTFCLRNKRSRELALIAAEYAEQPPDQRYAQYNAACYYALAEQAEREQAKNDPQRLAQADKYADRAMELLRQATEVGFTFDDRVHLMKDRDLDGLRSRADYAELVANLDKRFRGRPVTPADLLLSYREEYENAQAKYDRLRRGALTVSERSRAYRARPDFAGIMTKVLKLAQESDDTSAAVDALVWVLQSGAELSETARTTDTDRLAERAFDQLERFLDKPEFANACRVLAVYPSERGNGLLAKAASTHTELDVRGLAAFALGLALVSQAETAAGNSTLQTRLISEAEQQFERVIKDHEHTVYRDSTLGAIARRKLYEVRSLSVGRLAREISGSTLDDQTMTLSTTQGKVTVVFFWANWCGYCRMLFPNTREWVARYKDRPFAFLGVNCDEEKAAALRAVEREQLTWPSWWDGGTNGGKIAEEWHIDAFPNLYIIDHKGVIRKKWQGKPDAAEVEEAINALLIMAEQAQNRPDSKK